MALVRKERRRDCCGLLFKNNLLVRDPNKAITSVGRFFNPPTRNCWRPAVDKSNVA
jgi:hypothetical protein